MLSDLVSPYRGLRLYPFKATTTVTPSATIDQGKGQGDTIARTSAGYAFITQGKPNDYQGRCEVSTPGPAVDPGGYTTVDEGANPLSPSFRILDHTGAAVDGQAFSLNVTTNDPYNKVITKGPFLGDQVSCAVARDPIIYALGITSAGAAQIGAPLVSVAKASSIYGLTFRDTFAQAPFVFATPIHASVAKALRVNSWDSGQTSLATFQSGGTPEDNSFMVCVIGFRSKDPLYRQRAPIMTPRRRPRFIPLRWTSGATSPLAGSGDEIFTFTNGGTGIKTFNYASGYAPAAPGIVIISTVGSSARAQLSAFPTTTGFTALTFNAAGTAVDASLSGFVIDFGDTNEFRRG